MKKSQGKANSAMKLYAETISIFENIKMDFAIANTIKSMANLGYNRGHDDALI